MNTHSILIDRPRPAPFLPKAEVMHHTPRYRQVHLDFHTHESIPDVGGRFDKQQFQDVLREAEVDSVTCFAKCHHGWSYYDTKVGRKHPQLKTDLLRQQIEACKEIGIRTPIYLSTGHDELMARENPSWILRDRNGKSHPCEDALSAGYRLLRMNSPYLDYLARQVEEIVDLWPDSDGIFMDIVVYFPDYSEASLIEMRAWGLNPENLDEMNEYVYRCQVRYFDRINAAARKNRGDMPVFHNGGHIAVGAREVIFKNSHLELESLPTGGWGYDHFPLSARYAATTGLSYVGMTGKFHTSWGEFGGFKKPDALRYECLSSIAHGARCSIGDQLHPSGEMNRDTYRLVGESYRSVKAAEPWCVGSVLLASIGVVSAVKNQSRPVRGCGNSFVDEGVSRMLLETQLPFLVLDEGADWTPFQVIILPDAIELSPVLLRKAEAFIASGGSILASGTSLLNAKGDAFLLDAGIRFVGRSEYDPDYLKGTDLTPEIPIRSPVVIHGGAMNVTVQSAKVLLERYDPYFNRTWEHFTSHLHTPDAKLSAYPGATLTDGIAYFAHPIFTRYRLYGQSLYRDFIRSALCHLFGGSLPLDSNLPFSARVSVTEQRAQNRYVLHLLYATPSLKGSGSGTESRLVEVIEDIVPLYDRWVELDVDRSIKEVNIVPQGLPATFRMVSPTRCRVEVPYFHTHQMIELIY